MIITEFDIKILKIFYDSEKQESNIKILTEKNFPNQSKAFLRAKRKTVEYRVKRMIPELLRKIRDDNGNTKYKLVLKKGKEIIFENCQFPTTNKPSFLILIEEKWSIFEI